MKDKNMPAAPRSPRPGSPALDKRSRRLWWAALACGIVPLLLVSAWWAAAMSSGRAQREQAAVHEAVNLLAAIAESVAARTGNVDLALVAAVAHLEDDLARGAIDRARTRQHLQALSAERPDLDGLRVVDQAGIGVLGPGLEGDRRVDFSDRDWFIRQRDDPGAGLLMSEPLRSKLQDAPILSFSRRLRWPDGRFAGAVTAAVPLRVFSDLLRGIDPGPGGAIALRDLSQRLIARWPQAAPGSPAQAGSTQVSPELKTRLARGERRGHFLTDRLDGTRRLVSFQVLSSVPILLIVAAAESDYLAPWHRDLAQSAMAGALLVAMYLAVAAFALRELRAKLQAQGRISLLAEVFRNSAEAITLTDRAGLVVEVNDAFERVSGLRPGDVIGRSAMDLVSERTPVKVLNELQAALLGEGAWRGELWHLGRHGREFPALLSMAAVRDLEGRVSHHVFSAVDTTGIKRAEARILHMAHHDALTQLPNRASLQERLAQALALAQRERTALAVLFVDLDRFKHINDTLGHDVGDGLLIEVAGRLRRVTRQSDIVARLGGDEFVLVLNGLSPPATASALAVAEKARLLLDAPYQVSGHELHTSCSIGISLFPDDGQDGHALMRCADLAMYQAKAEGRNRVAFFSPEMNLAVSERLTLDLGLQHAIEREELDVHYQPQQRLSDGRIVAAEALIRWQHPTLGQVPPAKFIAIAEDNGLIKALGLWVLERALSQVAGWRQQFAPDFRVAVNVSAVQLMSEGFVEAVAAALGRHGLPAEALEIEITETAAMRDPERTVAQLHHLRRLGVALAIDDFGTGNSSLAYLKQLPLSCLKLDRSFVMDLEHDANDATICRATVQLAHALGLRVVAEGVENAAQLAYLHELACDLVQGYWIGRPVDAASMAAMLQGRSAAPSPSHGQLA